LHPTEIYSFGITPWHQGMVIVWHEIDPARSWLTVGYDEGRKPLPVNGNPSLGVTNSPPFGSGHHDVGIMASADGTDEALRPIGNGSLGAVSACDFRGCGFNDGRNPGTRQSHVAPRRGGTTQSGEHGLGREASRLGATAPKQPPHSRVSSAGRNKISRSPIIVLLV